MVLFLNILIYSKDLLFENGLLNHYGFSHDFSLEKRKTNNQMLIQVAP
jgi:hypothetical protein